MISRTAFSSFSRISAPVGHAVRLGQEQGAEAVPYIGLLAAEATAMKPEGEVLSMT